MIIPFKAIHMVRMDLDPQETKFAKGVSLYQLGKIYERSIAMSMVEDGEIVAAFGVYVEGDTGHVWAMPTRKLKNHYKSYYKHLKGILSLSIKMSHIKYVKMTVVKDNPKGHNMARHLGFINGKLEEINGYIYSLYERNAKWLM